MNNKESLHFKIGLSGSSTKKRPEVKIAVNGSEIVHVTLTQSPNITEYFEFDVEVSEGDCKLEISLLNKKQGDTIQDSQGNIIEDMMLSIDSIEIEEIDLSTLKWSASSYFPIYPEYYLDEEQKKIQEVKNCVNLGWNGVWTLPFSSPFYIWLLEAL